MSPINKIKVAIYSGCDYLDNIKGFGFGTIIDYFPKREKELIKKIRENCLRAKKAKIDILPNNC